MAIARDANAAGTVSSATSLTYSHTCTGSNRLLVIGVLHSADSITGVTYNGVSATFVKKHDFTTQLISLYGLANPSSGANNVVISASGAIDISAISVSYTGCAQTNQPGASADGGQGTTSPRETSLTTTADESWTVMLVRNITTGNSAAEADATLVRNANGIQFYDSNAGISPAGNTQLGVNFTGGNTVGSVIMEIKSTGTSFSVSDTQSSTDVISTVLGLWFSVSDTVTPSEAYTNFKIGFSNAVKSIATWINPDKS